MSNTAVLPRIGQNFDAAVHRILKSLGLGREARRRRATYIELSRLSDHQLKDIGLTRGLIETVVIQGATSVRELHLGGAMQRPANNDDRSARRFA